MANATFADRLNAALTERNISPSELSKRSGASEGLISGYRKGKYKAKQDRLDTFAQILDVSIPWLMGYDVSMGYYDGGLANKPIQPNLKGYSPMPETERKPRVGCIACGDPITAEENIETYDEVLSSWHADFTLMCVGDSMAPKIEDGDVVAIRMQPTVENGEIAAVRIGDEATLKKVYIHQDYIELRPINPAFESIIRRKEEMEDIRIEGKAVGLCRNL